MFAFFLYFKERTQPKHKEFRGLKAPKKGGFGHGILAEIFVFGCFFSALMKPPERGRKNGAARQMVEKCRKTFWHFLTIFDVFCPARKLSKNCLTLFDDFWRFLTWPLSAGPFCNPLINLKRLFYLFGFFKITSKHALQNNGKLVIFGSEKTMTARDVTGFCAFCPPGNRAIFSAFWGDFLNLHSKPGEKEKKSLETAPRNCRFLSLVVVVRVLAIFRVIFEFQKVTLTSQDYLG